MHYTLGYRTLATKAGAGESSRDEARRKRGVQSNSLAPGAIMPERIGPHPLSLTPDEWDRFRANVPSITDGGERALADGCPAIHEHRWRVKWASMLRDPRLHAL
jgi:hypothetical protein